MSADSLDRSIPLQDTYKIVGKGRHSAPYQSKTQSVHSPVQSPAFAPTPMNLPIAPSNTIAPQATEYQALWWAGIALDFYTRLDCDVITSSPGLVHTVHACAKFTENFLV